jgi:hypothetical protein
MRGPAIGPRCDPYRDRFRTAVIIEAAPHVRQFASRLMRAFARCAHHAAADLATSSIDASILSTTSARLRSQRAGPHAAI